MRTEAEVALRSPRSPDRDARVLENLLEEIERLTRLVSHLLFLCREDTGIGVLQFGPFAWTTWCAEVAEHMDVAAREKDWSLGRRSQRHVEVRGEPDRLRQLFFNLLDNAIKYTPPAGTVTVQGETSNGQARVTVTDTGIGIPRRAPAPCLRAVLSRRFLPKPGNRRKRTRTGHLPVDRRVSRGATGDRKRGR